MGRITKTGMTLLVASGILGGGVAPVAEAQGRPLSPRGSQILDFVNLFPGVLSTVLRTDAVRAGRFDITGIRGAEVRITFTLPAALAVAGKTVPLQFGAGDGGFAQANTIATATAFDPRVALVTRLSSQGRLFVWLGATAIPSPTQQAGAYAATITLTAAYTGN